MRLTLVVAMDEAGLIGAGNGLPWRLPADLAHFKRTTLDKPILMGRRTYESIGRPLPKRQNIVLTHRADFDAPGCDVVTTVDAALVVAEPASELMVIGGAQLYAACLARAGRIVLTRIHTRFQGDTYFPDVDLAGWSESAREFFPADARNAHDFSIIELVR